MLRLRLGKKLVLCYNGAEKRSPESRQFKHGAKSRQAGRKNKKRSSNCIFVFRNLINGTMESNTFTVQKGGRGSIRCNE